MKKRALGDTKPDTYFDLSDLPNFNKLTKKPLEKLARMMKVTSYSLINFFLV